MNRVRTVNTPNLKMTARSMASIIVRAVNFFIVESVVMPIRYIIVNVIHDVRVGTLAPYYIFVKPLLPDFGIA